MKQLHQFRAALAPALLILLISGPARAELRFGGFAEASYYATDEAGLDASSGFKLGQFVLHVNSPLTARLNAFAELTWTPRDDGYSPEVERVMIKYEHSDALKPSAGRYHTPVSWWNVAFHHGAWLQTSVDRPVAVKFGSKLIPIHLVGAMLEGKFFPGGFTVSYTGSLGNGRAENNARGGDTGDVNNHRATLVGLGLRHDALYDLQIGGAIYLDQFPIEADGSAFDEQILSAYLVYSSEKPEIIGEFFHVRHEDRESGLESTSTSYYVQAAWRLPFLDAKFKPYTRFENIDIDQADRALAPLVPDLDRFLVGVRIDVAAMVALKLEGRRFKEGDLEDVNEIYAALNFVF